MREVRTTICKYAPHWAFRLGGSDELVKLGAAQQTAGTLADYVRIGREFEQKFSNEHVAFMVARIGNLYGVKSGIGAENWDLGANAQSIRILDFAAKR